MDNRKFLVVALCFVNAAGLLGFVLKFSTYIGEPTNIVTCIGSGKGYTSIFFADGSTLWLREGMEKLVDETGDVWICEEPQRGWIFLPWPNWFDVIYMFTVALQLAILGFYFLRRDARARVQHLG